MKRVGSAIIILGLAFGQLVSSVPVYASDELPVEAAEPTVVDVEADELKDTQSTGGTIEQEAIATSNPNTKVINNLVDNDKEQLPAQGYDEFGPGGGLPPLAEKLLISKVQVGSFNSDSEEFVEIYNPDNTPVRLQGWSLDYFSATKEGDDAKPTRSLAKLDGVIIESRGFYVIASSNYEDIDYDSQFDKDSLAKTGGAISLADNGKRVDLVGWGNAKIYLKKVAMKAYQAPIERCMSNQNQMVDTGNNYNDFAVYDWDVKPTVRQVATCASADDPDDEQGTEPGSPINKCENLIITEIAPNINDQFVEIYNPTDKTIDLKDCQISTNRKTDKKAVFADIELAARDYEVVFLKGTGLDLYKSTYDTVVLRSSDGEVEQDSQYYENLKADTSWALVNDRWKQTYTLTPGEANVYTEFKPCQLGYERNEQTKACRKIVVESELKPCAPDQERNPETNRCRKIQASTNSLKSCLPGQERNPDTNRCRKVGTTASSLVPCKSGQVRNPDTNRCRSVATAANALKPCAANQERNPETNRCRKIGAKANSLKPCASGYERNPETNRCRKVSSSIGDVAGYAVEPVVDSAQSTVGWWAFGGVGLLASGYATWEWRSEISRFIRGVVFRR